jgi:hypothetical protein
MGLTMKHVLRLLCVTWLLIACTQEKDIPDALHGQVLANGSGQPLQGVMVSVEVINKGVGVVGPQGTVPRRVWATKGASTDGSGKFSLQLIELKKSLGPDVVVALTLSNITFTKQGFEQKTIKLEDLAAPVLMGEVGR